MISTYPGAKGIILCVDEDVSILRYEKALLERSGYMVLTAASPKQALRLVTMCDCDAVLLDYEILEMCGHQVALEVKLVRPKVGIVLIADGEVPTQALEVVDAFAPRVEESRTLLRMIAEICSRGRDEKHRQGGIQQEGRR
jgi:DNA-binding NtrC family response regulator